MIETYSRLEAAEIIDMDGDMLILNENTLAVTKLNESGGWIWKSLSEYRTFEVLVLRMTEEYKIDLEQATEDLQRFLKSMVDLGLVKRA